METSTTRAPFGEAFLQEHWDSACENMPEEYLNEVVAMMMPKRKSPPHLDSIQKIVAVRTKLEAREYPRPGQPAFDAPLEDWYREYSRRNQWFIAQCEAKK